MSKREKIYFASLYQNSKSKNFYKLYEYISQNPDQGYKEWKKAFISSKIGKNLAVEINTLYNNILRALHIYRIKDKKPGRVILQNLQFINILIEKGKIKPARKLLMKTKALALHHEEYSTLVNIISIQEELDISSIDANLTGQLEGLEKERELYIDYIQNYFRLKHLKAYLIELQYKVGIVIPDLIENHMNEADLLLLKDIDMAKTKKAKDLWLFNKAMVENFLGHFEMSAYYDEERIFFMEENQHLFPKIEYLKALNNVTFMSIDARNFEKANIFHQQFESYAGSTEVRPGMLEYFINYLGLRIYAFDDNTKTDPNIELSLQKLKKYENAINITQIGIWYMSILIALIKSKRIDYALEIMNRWESGEVKHYTFEFRKIIKIILYTELHSFSLLKSEIESYKKWIFRNNCKNETPKSILEFAKRCLSNGLVLTHKIWLKREFDRLELLDKEANYFLELNLKSWING